MTLHLYGLKKFNYLYVNLKKIGHLFELITASVKIYGLWFTCMDTIIGIHGSMREVARRPRRTEEKKYKHEQTR